MIYPSKGEVVIIKSREKNPAQWNFGVVEDLITGRDGVIRGAKLKSGKSHLERPIQHLYSLELSCDKSVQTPPETLNADAPESTGPEGMLQRQLDFASRV